MKQYKAPYFPEPPGIFDNLPQNRIIITDKEINTTGPAVPLLFLALSNGTTADNPA
jgi:hypothetical protein